MKNLLLLSVLFIIAASTVNAQVDTPYDGSAKSEKLRKMEKLKLLEALELDEETAVRFFTRRDKNLREIKSLMDKRKSLLDKLDEKLKNKTKSYKNLTEEILQLEREIFEKRAEFINSLDDILNEEQIAKVIVFENKFKKEIRNYFFRGKRGMMHRMH